jgi:hypothetical protein
MKITMSNNKQTAVEWLVSQQKHNQFFDIETIEIAKEMEKEQIMEAHYAPKYGCFSEDYYEQTYGGNK